MILTIYNGKSDIVACVQTSPLPQKNGVEGMPEIEAKRFPSIAFHRFPLLLNEITWSLTIFIDFDFFGCSGK